LYHHYNKTLFKKYTILEAHVAYLGLIIGILVLDQVTKYMAETQLSAMNTYPLWENIFHLTYSRNTGAAFSILRNKQTLLIGITLVVMVFLSVYLYKSVQSQEPWMLNLALAMILGGGIGNLIDRVRLNYVIDFFDFTLINYPIFNIADCFIVIGTVVLGYLLIFSDIKI